MIPEHPFAPVARRSRLLTITPEAMQWVFVAVLVAFYLASRTSGPIGNFLRGFSAFIFP